MERAIRTPHVYVVSGFSARDLNSQQWLNHITNVGLRSHRFPQPPLNHDVPRGLPTVAYDPMGSNAGPRV